MKRPGYPPKDFTRARDASKQILARPVYPELAGEQMKYVVDCIAESYRQECLMRM